MLPLRPPASALLDPNLSPPALVSPRRSAQHWQHTSSALLLALLTQFFCVGQAAKRHLHSNEALAVRFAFQALFQPTTAGRAGFGWASELVGADDGEMPVSTDTPCPRPLGPACAAPDRDSISVACRMQYA